MIARTFLAVLLLMASVSTAWAQNELDRLIAHCGGAQNVIQLANNNLGCKSAPTGTDASTIAGLGNTFMQILQGLEADAQRRAAEQRARRNLALQILQQHRDAALNRQDAARAQQLAEIESRLARSENLFKGMTGAGAQLGIKTQSSGGLQLKTGRAAMASLDPPPAPSASTASSVEPVSEADALLKQFNSLPADEQAALVRELQSRLASQGPQANDVPGDLKDAPGPVTRSLADIEPIEVPEGLTPEQIAETAERLFFGTAGQRTTDAPGPESSVVPAVAGSGPPPPGGTPAPDTSRQAGDPCAFAPSLDTSVVDLREVRCAAERLGSRRAPLLRERDTGRDVRHLTADVMTRPPSFEELKTLHAIRDFGAVPAVVTETLRRDAGPISETDRRKVIGAIAPEILARYVQDASTQREVADLLDPLILAARRDRYELDVLAWIDGLNDTFKAIKRHPEASEDAAALLQIPAFVAERDAIAMATEARRRSNAEVVTLRFMQVLAIDLKRFR